MQRRRRRMSGSAPPGSAGLGPRLATADVNVDLGGAGKTLRATVDVNGNGVIDTDSTVAATLDINGDGILNVLDDVNGDGILSGLDLGGIDLGAVELPISISLPTPGGGDTPSFGDDAVPGGGFPLPGGPGGGPGSDPGGPGGGPGPVAGAPDDDGDDVGRVLGNLNEPDYAALKLKCADVMGNPGEFDAATIKVCRVLASL